LTKRSHIIRSVPQLRHSTNPSTFPPHFQGFLGSVDFAREPLDVERFVTRLSAPAGPLPQRIVFHFPAKRRFPMSATVAPAPIKREVTQKMIDANRRNSLKSTGPKTEAGKARCSQNAITHGIFAQNMALTDEEGELYDQFRLEMLLELNPGNYQEMRCAEIVVNCYWKLRRCDAAEMRLLNKAMLNVDKYAQPESDRALAHAIAKERDYGLSRLSVYHQRLLNQIHKAMRELRQLRKESITPGDVRGDSTLTPFLARQLDGEGYVPLEQPQEPQSDAEREEREERAEREEREEPLSESSKSEPCAEASAGRAMENESEDLAEDDVLSMPTGVQPAASPPEYRQSA
jgi:hypothetical protein